MQGFEHKTFLISVFTGSTIIVILFFFFSSLNFFFLVADSVSSICLNGQDLIKMCFIIVILHKIMHIALG